MEEEDEDENGLAALALSPRAAPKKGGKGLKAGFFSLFSKKGKKKDKNAAPPDSPLKKDSEQERLVAEARKKSKGNSKNVVSPRAPAKSAPGGAPPPLPVKVRRGSLEDLFKLCEDGCGARNNVTREYCVSCGLPLGTLDNVEEVQRKLDAELQTRREAAEKAEREKAEREKLAQQAEDHSSSDLSEEEAVLEASQCVVSGAGIQGGPQRVMPTDFVVEPRGPEGQALLKAASEVVAHVVGPGGVEIAVDRRERADGAVELSYDRSRAGEYRVRVETAGGVAVANSPYILVAEAVPDPALCEASGPGLDSGVFAKVPTEFTVSLRDISNVYIEEDAGARVTAEFPEAATVTSNGDGTFLVALEYGAPGTHNVAVFVNDAHIKGSPFSVEVAKKPSAGEQWQERFQQEAELRRLEREKERQAEIEEARDAYIESAKLAVNTAAQKEAAQLEEEQRQREIEKHMEEMRSPRGDEVRAKVLAKLQEQAVTDTTLEPEGDESKAGAKWASKFREEDEARKAEREAQRLQEIEEAKVNFIETAEEAKQRAAVAEAKQLQEEKRQREIAEHQEEVRRRGLEDDHNDKLSSEDSSTFEESSGEEEPVVVREREVVAVDGGRRRGRQQGIPADNGVVLEYAKVKNNVSLYAGDSQIHSDQIEAHFAEEEFKTVFAMSKSDFYKLPNWRRAQMRKEKGL